MSDSFFDDEGCFDADKPFDADKSFDAGSSFDVGTFDSVVDAAWREFAERLAGGLPGLERDQSIEIIHQSGDGYRLLISLITMASGRVRAEIDDVALEWRNRPQWNAQHDQLIALGWRFLTRKRTFIVDVGQRDAYRLADLVALTLRRIWDCAHPAFVAVHQPPTHIDDAAPGAAANESNESNEQRVRPLSIVPDTAPDAAAPESAAPDSAAPDSAVTESAADDTPSTSVAGQKFSDSSADPIVAPALPDGMTLAVVPADTDHLLEVARVVLSALLGREQVIVDGLIEIAPADAMAWRVFADPHGPGLVFSTTLTHRLTDPAPLGTLMVEHSARWREITLVVDRDHVYAQRLVDAAVLHPTNIEVALCTWQQFLAESDGAGKYFVALNAGGPGSHACAHSTVPVGLQTLFELAATRPLTAERIAHLTNRKTNRLYEYLEVCTSLVSDAESSCAALRRVGAGIDEIEDAEESAAFLRSFAGLLDGAIRVARAKGA